MSTIAQALGIGLPTASHLVEKLVRAGLVQRAEDPKDRRHTLVHLTQQGEDLIEHLSQDRLELLRLWLSQLTEEELTALRLCWRMTQMVESGVTPPKARATARVAPPISGGLIGAFVYGRGIPLRVPWLSDCTVAFIRQQSPLRVGLQALVRVTETAQPSEEQCQH